MKTAKDPVCGMEVETASAAGQSTHKEKTYYFCSADCKKTFDGEPARYAEAVREPPFKKQGGVPTPKFGSAGSGGLEFESQPSRKH